MFASLTGIGLASAAGLNAYVPLLVLGLLARYTELLPLSPTWTWLEHPVTLIILGMLFVVELVADKVPAIDTVNDVLQTFVRPTSGGITFGAGVSTFTLSEITGEASGMSAVAGGVAWGAVIAGATIALFFHLAKAIARPVINVLTFGLGAPVVSFLEDVASFFVALLAVLLPLLIVIVFPLMLVLGVWAIRKGRKARAEERAQKQARRAAARPPQGPGHGSWHGHGPGHTQGPGHGQGHGTWRGPGPGTTQGPPPGTWQGHAPGNWQGPDQRGPWDGRHQ